MNKATLKFNNGNGALLCSGCRVILKQGFELSHIDWKCIRGEQELEAQYCKKCENKT